MSYQVTYNLYGEKFTRVHIKDEQTAKNEAHSLRALGASNINYTQEVE